jgi:hypothetical protein
LQLRVLFVDKSQGLFQGHLNMETKSHVDVYVLCIWASQAKRKERGKWASEHFDKAGKHSKITFWLAHRNLTLNQP